MPFHRKRPAKALSRGTSLRLHGHINSAHAVIRNWEDYRGERAEKGTENQLCNKQKSGTRTMKRLIKVSPRLDFFNSCRFKLLFWETQLISGDFSPFVASSWWYEWCLVPGETCPVSSFAVRPTTRPLSILMTALHKDASRPDATLMRGSLIGNSRCWQHQT